MGLLRHLPLLALFLLLSSAVASSQTLDLATAGRDYILTFPDTTWNTYDVRFTKVRMTIDSVAVQIFSSSPNRIVLRHSNGDSIVATMRANTFTTLHLDDSPSDRHPLIAGSRFGTTTRNSARLHAEQPVIVTAFLISRFGMEACTPLPVSAWGERYVVTAAPGEIVQDETPGGETDYRTRNRMGPAAFCVVAAHDSTRVTVRPGPNAQFLSEPLGDVILSAGEVRQWRSLVDTLTANMGNPQPDLSGTVIEADKPIGVVVANSRAQLNPDESTGLARNSFKNYLMEWLAPVEQWGREHVFLPVWDSRRILGVKEEKIADKRPGEFVFIQADSAGSMEVDGWTRALPAGGKVPFRFGDPVPRVIRTSVPTQILQAPIATTIFRGMIGSPGFLGASYDAYGSYLTHVTPRELWSTFAPHRVPSYPPGFEHFINIVASTDDASRIFDHNGEKIDFNHGAIAGSDLVWGTMSVPSDQTIWIEGRDGARFYAYAYGFRKGYEMYRPGRAGKRDDGADLTALHPSEYEEDIGLAYGFPLAPRRLDLTATGELTVGGGAEGCGNWAVHVRPLDARPAALFRAALEAATNVTLVPTATGRERIGRGDFVLLPERRDRPSSATLLVQDARGRVQRQEISFFAEPLRPSLPLLQFGEMQRGSSRDLSVRFENMGQQAITVTSSRLVGAEGYALVATDPPLPTTLAPGESLEAQVRCRPTTGGPSLVTRLELGNQECSFGSTLLGSWVASTCMDAHDLDFGVLPLAADSVVTREVDLCNGGSGELRLVESGGSIVRVEGNGFAIDQAEIDRLKGVTLYEGECVTLHVRFRPDQIGTADGRLLIGHDASCGTHEVALRATVERDGTRRDNPFIQMTLRPNPSRGSVPVLDLEAESTAVVEISIATIEGVSISRQSIALPAKRRQSIHLPTGDLAPGHYLVELRAGTWSTALPLSIDR